jgi:peptidoglycan hydrolase FlgJ
MVAPTNALASDLRSLDALRARSGSDPKGAIKEAAKAFETLFMQELMKSMRAATLPSGMFEDQGGKLGTDLLDTQYAAKMSGLPGGLSEMIARQLERQMGLAPGPIPNGASANPVPAPLAGTAAPASAVRIPQRAAAGFVQQHTEAARAAQAQTGIPAEFMISQAALETGWGRNEIRHADGSTSFNLFGIKAEKVTATFRAYSSYAESFADYARLMKDSPRYAQVVAQGNDASGFAQGLQRAGYATDPAYADKLTRVINTTLRLQRSTS